MGHALLSPSSSERWLNCPGSVRLSEKYPNEDSIHSWRGTVLHDLVEKQLADESLPGPGTEFKCPTTPAIVYELTADDLDMVDACVDKVREYQAGFGEVFTEIKLDMQFFIREGSGTTDVLLIVPCVGMWVIDHKFGYNYVSPMSTQLACYAIAAYEKFGSEYLIPEDNINTVILQPATSGPLEEEHLWDWGTLCQLRTDLHEAGERAWIGAPVAEFKAGDWCKYCPAKPECPVLREESRKRVDDVFGPSAEERAEAMSPEEIAAELNMVPALLEYADAIVKRANKMAIEQGVKIPGRKLVQGRKGDRKWSDEKKVEATLRKKKVKVSDMYSQKLKTPAQMEKVTDIDLSAFITQSPGKVTLVPESDKRKEVAPADLVFDKVTE